MGAQAIDAASAGSAIARSSVDVFKKPEGVESQQIKSGQRVWDWAELDLRKAGNPDPSPTEIANRVADYQKANIGRLNVNSVKGNAFVILPKQATYDASNGANQRRHAETTPHHRTRAQVEFAKTLKAEADAVIANQPAFDKAVVDFLKTDKSRANPADVASRAKSFVDNKPNFAGLPSDDLRKQLDALANPPAKTPEAVARAAANPASAASIQSARLKTVTDLVSGLKVGDTLDPAKIREANNALAAAEARGVTGSQVDTLKKARDEAVAVVSKSVDDMVTGMKGRPLEASKIADAKEALAQAGRAGVESANVEALKAALTQATKTVADAARTEPAVRAREGTKRGIDEMVKALPADGRVAQKDLLRATALLESARIGGFDDDANVGALKRALAAAKTPLTAVPPSSGDGPTVPTQADLIAQRIEANTKKAITDLLALTKNGQFDPKDMARASQALQAAGERKVAGVEVERLKAAIASTKTAVSHDVKKFVADLSNGNLGPDALNKAKALLRDAQRCEVADNNPDCDSLKRSISAATAEFFNRSNARGGGALIASAD